MRKIDETDMRILRAMQKDGSMTVAEIAEAAGLSQSPCSRRISQLEDAGVILGKSVKLDRRKLGFDVNIDVRVKIDAHTRDALDIFKREVQLIPEVQMAVLVMGEYDFRLRVVVRDIEHYRLLLQERLSTIKGVQEMHSSVILEVVKDTTELPI